MKQALSGPVYVARIDTKYEVTGVGHDPETARHAACVEYRRTKNSGYGFINNYGERIYTDEQIDGWYGVNVVGPIPVPGGATE